MRFLTIFTGSILPILSIALLGYLLGWIRNINAGPLNTITLYVLMPALTFHSFTTTPMSPANSGRIILGVVLFTAVMTALSYGVTRWAGHDQPRQSSLILSSVFPNCGNFGIPLCEFVFGPPGRVVAVLYVTVQSILVYTLGVFVAAVGSGRSGAASTRGIFKLPLVYAALAAVVVRTLGWVPPQSGSLMRIIGMLGNASIPVMLLVFGVQLAGIRPTALAQSALPTVLKLGVAPAVGLWLALGLGFSEPVLARVFVLECSMPSAVLPLLLTVSFASSEADSNRISAPEYVSSTILTTTLSSVLTLTGVILLLESGWVL